MLGFELDDGVTNLPKTAVRILLKSFKENSLEGWKVAKFSTHFSLRVVIDVPSAWNWAVWSRTFGMWQKWLHSSVPIETQRDTSFNILFQNIHHGNQLLWKMWPLRYHCAMRSPIHKGRMGSQTTTQREGPQGSEWPCRWVKASWSDSSSPRQGSKTEHSASPSQYPYPEHQDLHKKFL